MQWLVRGASPNDSLFFHCVPFSLSHFGLHHNLNSTDSGHGGQTKDLDGDEGDGFDEGLFFLLLRSSYGTKVAFPQLYTR